MTRIPWWVVVIALGAHSCNQPFEPDAPGNSRLVVYSILNVDQGTQYVRVQSTYGMDPGAPLRGASVQMSYNGGVIQFRDTTIERNQISGMVEQLDLYVAHNVPMEAGRRYLLEARSPSGLSAQATTTALGMPELSIRQPGALGKRGNGPITLATSFGSVTGAWEMHFYIEFYALVGGGWELHREEVPEREYVDNAGQVVKVFPGLIPVPVSSSPNNPMVVTYDTLMYERTRARIVEHYQVTSVVWMYAVFNLTQVDNTLYSYYYVNNGPEEKTSIRLDTPEFTNIRGGLGVFGSSARVSVRFTLRE